MPKKKCKKKKASDKPTVVDGDFSTANDGQNGNRVFVSLGKTISLGNYEFIRVEYGEGRTVQNEESFDYAKAECLKRALDGIQEMIPIVENALK